MAEAYHVWTGTVIECTRPWGRTRAYVQVMSVTTIVVLAFVLQRWVCKGNERLQIQSTQGQL